MQNKELAEQVEEVQNSFGFVKDKLSGWLEEGIALLPNLVVAILVVVFFGLLSKLVRTLSNRFLRKVTRSPAISRLLSTLAGIAVVVLGVFIALGVVGLDKTVTSLLAGAGVIGIALAFAFQDVAANLIAGVYLSFQRPFVNGDFIETNEFMGTVMAVDLRTTTLKTTRGQIATLPNKEIFENLLVNYSKSGTRRVDLAVGVSYGEDLERVREIAAEAISALEMRDTDKDVDILYEGFGGSSIDFVARFWIDFQRQIEYKTAVSEAVIAVKQAFDNHDIMIPFPIRTLDFGIKGGETLRQALPESLAGTKQLEAGNEE